MREFAGWTLILGLLGSPVACSSSSSGSNTIDAAPIAVDQFQQEFANVICDTTAPCCMTANIPYTEATCKANTLDELNGIAEYELGPNSEYEPDAAGACLNAIKKRLQSCEPYDDDGTVAACRSVFVGKYPKGTECLSAAQCADGYCLLRNINGGGTCGSKTGNFPRGKLGSACAGTCYSDDETLCTIEAIAPTSNILCHYTDGLYCSFESNRCVPLASLGQACIGTLCTAGNFCDSTSVTCQPLPDTGSCLVTNACSAKSFCDETFQCVAKQPDGASCRYYSDCVSGNCIGGGSVADGTCVTDKIAAPSTCAGAVLFDVIK